MRTVIKNTLCSLLFLGILIGMLALLSVLFRPKENTQEAGFQDPRANAVLSEPKDTIDVVFLGDSETYNTFIPLQIWLDYGYTSFVCGTPAQSLCYTEEFLVKAFAQQSPQIVFLETDAIFKIFTQSQVISQDVENTLPVFRYHDRWKTLQASDWTFQVDYSHRENNKGYMYDERVRPSTRLNYMKKTDAKEEIPGKSRQAVENIYEYCRKNNAKLVLISTPSTAYWNYKRHNSVAELAESLGVEYVDMNLINDQVGIEWSTDTRDRGMHMNIYGARKCSAFLGAYLAKTEQFQDKRKDASYADWFDALEAFNESTDNALDRPSPEPEDNTKKAD